MRTRSVVPAASVSRKVAFPSPGNTHVPQDDGTYGQMKNEICQHCLSSFFVGEEPEAARAAATAPHPRSCENLQRGVPKNSGRRLD